MVALSRPVSTMSRLLPGRGAPRSVAIFWCSAAVVYLLVLAYCMVTYSYATWPALVIVPVLAAITIPLLRRIARNEADPVGMFKLLSLGFVAKIVGTLLRYAVTFGVYGDRADATGYHGAGTRLAHAFHQGPDAFRIAAEIDLPELTGTPFINLVTMVVYLVIGSSILGGFLVFSWLSFWGMVWFYRACVVAFPEANHRRYAVLLFFLPTMIYWPSSIGKEAWMIFTMGLATYGVALVLKHKPLGYLTTGLGLLGTAMVRPHVTVLIFMSLLFAYMLRRRSWRESRLGPVGKFVGVAVLLVAGGLVLMQAASFFDLDQVDSQAATQVLDEAGRRSGQGDSEFEAGRPTSPIEFPNAMLAVLFRPFIWEASNVQAAFAALEGSLLLVLTGMSTGRLVRLPHFLFRVPYIAFCLAFVVMFVFAFSTIGNFGILTRQRTQVFPFMLVLLVMPIVEHVRKRDLTLEDRINELTAERT
ncbi:MAG TPA: hypothetical protein VIL48_15825 [Acidimicrobiales bacterium]